MDIKSLDEKRFFISRIIKTIIIQIDDNGNGSETTIIDPETNLILTAIMEYCKKNEIAEYTKISSDEINQNKQNEIINGKINNLLDIKRNNSISSKEKNIPSNKSNTDIISANKNAEKTVKHKHRFLSQDANVVQNYNYLTPNQQYFIERNNVIDTKDNTPMLNSFINSSYINTSTINNEYVNPNESEAKNAEEVFSSTDASFRKIKKSNFIQRFYELNK